MYTYSVINKPTGRSYLGNVSHDLVELKKASAQTGAYQSAVAQKHSVLPTYMGSLSTLKGNPSTRWSIKMPK